MIEIAVELFGKPSWELSIEGGRIDPGEIRAKGGELKERLERTAEIAEKLLAGGWEYFNAAGSIYDLRFSKEVTRGEVERELRSLGIDPAWVSIEELAEE